MTELNKKIERVTKDTVFYRGRHRRVIVVLLPPCLVGFRLEGCPTVYSIPAQAGYWQALKAHTFYAARQKREK
jgi:hypothetical protein